MEKGLESFKAAVMKDCQGGENCFFRKRMHKRKIC